MLKQSPNKFGSLSIIDDGNLVASEGKLAATYKVDSSIISINNDPSKEILETDPILYHDGPYIVDLKDNGQIMHIATNDPANYRINEAIDNNSKPWTALFQGGEDDEPMVHQNINLGAFTVCLEHNIMKEYLILVAYRQVLFLKVQNFSEKRRKRRQGNMLILAPCMSRSQGYFQLNYGTIFISL